MPSNDRFNIIPASSGQQGTPSEYTSGFQFQYMPLFMEAAIRGGYLKDNSRQNQETHSYNLNIDAPVGKGISATYGVNGYDSRYSSPQYSQSYRGVSPSIGLNYTNGNWNMYAQKQQNQSPYFGINYNKQF